MINSLFRYFWDTVDRTSAVGASFGPTTAIALLIWFGVGHSAFAEALPIDTLPEDREVLFSRDIAPLLKKNCVACHNASTEEGGVNLESVAKMKSSEVDGVLVPGKPEASRLFILASHAEDPVMPPEDNDVSASNLGPVELAMLRRWVKSGARVDQATDIPSDQVWQPLPTALQTVYGSAMTDDGRMAVVSFGNQVRVFGTKSIQPIGVLERSVGDQVKPAHDDFVQDLFLNSSGRQVVSAGYRNVKLWEMIPFESTPIPAIEHDDVLAVSMDPRGDHVAILSRRGELSVAEIGKNRWQWMKSFDLPDSFHGDEPPQVRLAVGADAREVAVQWANTVRIVRIDAIEPETIDVANKITSMIWRPNGQLAVADETGHATFWTRDGDVWTSTEHDIFDQPILKIVLPINQPEQMVAIDVTGKIAQWNATDKKFTDAGKLSAPAVSASLSPSGDLLWVTTAVGVLAQYNIADEKWVEVAKANPVAEARLGADRWTALVGERLVAARDTLVKQAQANVTAEKASIEKFVKEIESKSKLREEKQKSVEEAKKAAEAEAVKLAKAKSTEKAANENRSRLAESIKKNEMKVAQLEAELEMLKAEKAAAEKQLAAIPDTKKLSDAVKAATEAATKADAEKVKKDGELSDAAAALELAEATKIRGEKRLQGLTSELQRRQESLKLSKTEQEQRKTAEAASKTERDQSRAADQKLAVLSAGSRIVTRTGSPDDPKSGTWSLWSGAGDWLAELPELPSDGELIAAGDNGVLIKDRGGKTYAMNATPRLWQLKQTIGSSSSESPFADRVLSVDIDPSGHLLATGGGEPSRAGELMIWNATDGSLIREFEDPHDDTVLCVCFSPDGKTLATGGADRMVKLWDVESGKLLRTLEGHTHHVTTIAWNVNQQQLASGSADASVKIWDLNSGQSTRTISGLKTEVTKLVYVGRDDRIGIAGGDSYFRVYRTDNGARETNTKVVGGYLYALDANRDGSLFVVGGADGVASVVDKSGKQQLEYTSNAD